MSNIEIINRRPIVNETEKDNVVIVSPTGVKGPQGYQGEPGSSAQSGHQGPQGQSGQPRYIGQGPPQDPLVGAIPGDMYLDEISGILYRLT